MGSARPDQLDPEPNNTEPRTDPTQTGLDLAPTRPADPLLPSPSVRKGRTCSRSNSNLLTQPTVKCIVAEFLACRFLVNHRSRVGNTRLMLEVMNSAYICPARCQPHALQHSPASHHPADFASLTWTTVPIDMSGSADFLKGIFDSHRECLRQCFVQAMFL